MNEEGQGFSFNIESNEVQLQKDNHEVQVRPSLEPETNRPRGGTSKKLYVYPCPSCDVTTQCLADFCRHIDDNHRYSYNSFVMGEFRVNWCGRSPKIIFWKHFYSNISTKMSLCLKLSVQPINDISSVYEDVHVQINRVQPHKLNICHS